MQQMALLHLAASAVETVGQGCGQPLRAAQHDTAASGLPATAQGTGTLHSSISWQQALSRSVWASQHAMGEAGLSAIAAEIVAFLQELKRCAVNSICNTRKATR
jgi:hypothetical protein